MSEGGSTVAPASPAGSIEAIVSDADARAAGFKSTVAEGRFELVYQPIVDLGTRTLHHYEALSRFEEGVSPYETIRFAEDVSLIAEFDLAACLRVLETLRAAGAARPLIAVNISARSFGEDAFVTALEALLASYAECRRHLMFEMTESVQIQDLTRVANVIQALRRSGHRVCLDDFGAGSASFPYLRALRVDFIKIDGAYVRQAVSDKRDRAILRSMAMLCRELKVATIAEMIETGAQAELLSTLRVGYGQGWLFGRPGPLPQ